MLTISGKAIGRKRPLFADWSIPLPPELADDDDFTLRMLIGFVVRSEVEAFQGRQQDQQLVQALTATEITESASLGKVTSGGSEVTPQPIDADEAIAVALQAFLDGLFLVVIDGQEYRDLDAAVLVQHENRVTFVRLTLLAGG